MSELASAGVTAPNSVLGVGTSCQNWCQDPQFLRYMGSFTLQSSRSLSSQGGWGSSSALASALFRSSPPLLLSVIVALAAASNSSVSSGHAAVPLTIPLPVTSSAQSASDEDSKQTQGKTGQSSFFGPKVAPPGEGSQGHLQAKSKSGLNSLLLLLF